jgi:hypothetical protein
MFRILYDFSILMYGNGMVADKNLESVINGRSFSNYNIVVF